MKRLALLVGIGAAALAVLILAPALALPDFLDLPRGRHLAAPVLRVDILGTLREVESKKLERGLRDLLRRFR